MLRRKINRSNILSIISLFLLVVIISPTVLSAIDYQDNCKVINLSDEENNKEGKKKGDNEIEEEDLLLLHTSNHIYAVKESIKSVSTSYMIKKYNHIRDILLPPPRLNV